MGVTFFSKEVAKHLRPNPRRKQSVLQFPRFFPNNYLVEFSKLPCESRLGFIYDSHFTDNETEDWKRQGHRAREPVEKMGADHGFPVTTQLSPHQSTLYLAKQAFNKTRLILSPCKYVHIYQPKLYFHVSSFSMHLCNLLPMIDSHHLLTFLESSVLMYV